MIISYKFNQGNIIRFKELLCVVSYLTCISAFAGDFDNGDFSKGKKDWKINSKSISITDDDRKSLQVILDEEDEIVFRQKFKVDRKSTKIFISYKTKASEDFKPLKDDEPGFMLWFLEENNTRWFNTPRRLTPGVWVDQKSIHDVHDEVREVQIEIIVQPGKGKIYFDDFEIEVKEED